MTPCPPPARQQDELACPAFGCGLRWAVGEDRPPCAIAAEKSFLHRERLEKVASGYHDLAGLRREQNKTAAKMIRACVAQIGSNDVRKRLEGIAGLKTLAEMLEKDA